MCLKDDSIGRFDIKLHCHYTIQSEENKWYTVVPSITWILCNNNEIEPIFIINVSFIIKYTYYMHINHKKFFSNIIIIKIIK